MAGSSINRYQNQEMGVKIKNDLNDYFRYIDLLQRNRSEKNQRKIDSYVKSETNISLRIAFIEELDQKEEELIERQISEEADLDSKETRKELEKKTKTVLEVNSFFNFFFSSRKSIKNYGDRTHVITGRLFSLKLSNDAVHYYQKILGKAISLALPPVNYILKHAWESLDRKTYNVVSTFFRFLNHFTHHGNILSHDDIKVMMSKVETFIEPYLQVVGYKNDIELLKEAFYRILFTIPSFNKQFKDIIGFVAEMTNTESRGLYFSNILLGIYMLKYKQFIKLNDLIDYYDIQIINDYKYDYTPRVIKDIKSRLENLEIKYIEAEKEVFFLKFLEDDFDFDRNPEETDLTDLFADIYYYEKPQLKDDRKDLYDGKGFLNHIIEGDISATFLQFVRGFLGYYSPFLKGEMKLSGPEKENSALYCFFMEWLFSQELHSLNEDVNELDSLKKMTPYLSISLDTFNDNYNTGKSQSEKEDKFCNSLKRIISNFYELGEKATTILYNNNATQNLSGSKKLAATNLQETPIEEIGSAPRLLPYAMHQIAEDDNLQDKLLINVLNEVTIFCLNFCYLFKYHPLTIRLIKKQKFIDVTEEYYSIKAKANG